MVLRCHYHRYQVSKVLLWKCWDHAGRVELPRALVLLQPCHGGGAELLTHFALLRVDVDVDVTVLRRPPAQPMLTSGLSFSVAKLATSSTVNLSLLTITPVRIASSASLEDNLRNLCLVRCIKVPRSL